MQISDIYARFKIPPNLQSHMFRVAAVGAFIADSWDKPQSIERSSIIVALLFHDVGNIIKYDFRFAALMGEKEAGRVDYWRQVQKEFADRYKNDEHIATIEIANEVGIEKRAMDILSSIGSSKLELTNNSTDWSLKIAAYSDFRVDPHEVVTVDKRFDDIIMRYKDRSHVLGKIEETELKRKRCLILEEQLQRHLDFRLPELDNEIVNSRMDEIMSFDITTRKS